MNQEPIYPDAHTDKVTDIPNTNIYDKQPVPTFNPTPSPVQVLGAPTANNQVQSDLSKPAKDQPMAVVQVLSVRGVEYTMMMLPLWIIAGSLIWILLSIINGLSSFTLLAFPASLLVVCVPVFAYLFIRLRRAELADPNLRFDPSKRKLTQLTQIVAYAAILFNLIAFVYQIINKLGGEGSGSLMKSGLSLLVVMVVAGGILAYYWLDEHRNFNK